MSKNISYQFSAVPVQWLTDRKLSAQEKIILSVLIFKSDESGYSRIGYEALSNLACCCLRQCKYLVNDLISRGYIIKHSGIKPICLQINFACLGGDTQNTVNSAIDCTINEEKECNLMQKKVQFDAKESATDCTLSIFKNRFKNKNTRMRTREEMETPDVAGVRSKPINESAKEDFVETQSEITDFLLVDDFKKRFESILLNIRLLKVGNKFAVRPYPSFKDFDKIKSDIDRFFAEKKEEIFYIKPRHFVAGEIILL